jgi:hypothetical protein
MKKQPKTLDQPRKAGPKFAKSVIPDNFQIRRQSSPMATILDEAERSANLPERSISIDLKDAEISTPVNIAPEKITPVKLTPVKIASVSRQPATLPDLEVFIDHVLPRFPPAQQAVLLRLYRWSDGSEKEITVSTPRLAAKVNLDEKSVRSHLQSLTAQGFIIRQMDGQHHARFGGNDRAARGLILRLSAAALRELIS